MGVLEGAGLLPARLHLWPRKLPGLPGTLGGPFLVAGKGSPAVTDSVNTEDGASASGWEIGIGLSHRTRGASALWCPPTPAAPISLATRLFLRWPVGCRCPGASVRAVTALHGAPKLARSRASLGPVSTHRDDVSWPSAPFSVLALWPGRDGHSVPQELEGTTKGQFPIREESRRQALYGDRLLCQPSA